MADKNSAQLGPDSNNPYLYAPYSAQQSNSLSPTQTSPTNPYLYEPYNASSVANSDTPSSFPANPRSPIHPSPLTTNNLFSNSGGSPQVNSNNDPQHPQIQQLITFFQNIQAPPSQNQSHNSQISQSSAPVMVPQFPQTAQVHPYIQSIPSFTTTISPTLPSILRTFPTFTPKAPTIPPIASAQFPIPIVTKSNSYLAEANLSSTTLPEEQASLAPSNPSLLSPALANAVPSPLPQITKLANLSSPLLNEPPSYHTTTSSNARPATDTTPPTKPPTPTSTSTPTLTPTPTSAPALVPHASFFETSPLSTDSSTPNQVGTGDWNRDYQALLRLPDSPSKFMAITNLANEFAEIAKEYGRIIINEKHLPAEEKTIKPKSFGGIAGGEKFMYHHDKCMPTGTWIYGGTQRNDENAGKAASHELKGAQALHHYARAWADEFHDVEMLFPLVSLVDYRGSRLFAVSVLPLTSSSLVYGSDDAAATVHKDIPAVNDAMTIICGKMNLKPHCVGAQNIVLAGPGDLEVHQVFDLTPVSSAKSVASVSSSSSIKSKTHLPSSSISQSSTKTTSSTSTSGTTDTPPDSNSVVYSTPGSSTYNTYSTSNNNGDINENKNPHNITYSAATSNNAGNNNNYSVNYAANNANNSSNNAITYSAPNITDTSYAANYVPNNITNNATYSANNNNYSAISSATNNNATYSATNNNNHGVTYSAMNNNNNHQAESNSTTVNSNNSIYSQDHDNPLPNQLREGSSEMPVNEGYGLLTAYSSADTDDTMSAYDFSSDASVYAADDTIYSYSDMYGAENATNSGGSNIVENSNIDIRTPAVPPNDRPIYGSSYDSNNTNSYASTKSDDSMNSITSNTTTFGNALANLNSFYGQTAGLQNRKPVGTSDSQAITCYVLDFARVFPPESPIASQGPMQEVFHKLLRPELVYKYSQPLSSDAFSGFNRTPQRKLDNEAVTNATLWLYNTVIPDVAIKWNTLFQKWDPVNSDPEKLAQNPNVQKWKVSSEMHSEGINMRHLGRIRDKLPNKGLSYIVLSEMIARVLKNKMRELHREITSYQASVKCAAYFLNIALRPKTLMILQLLQQKYLKDIYGITWSPTYLWQRILELTGVQVSDRVAKPDASWQVLLESDILRLDAQIKRMDIVDLAHGTSLYLTALKLMEDQDHIHKLSEDISGISEDNLINCKFSETQPLLESAKQKLKVVAQSNPRNYKIPLLLGLVESQKWKFSGDVGTLASAREFFEQSLTIAEQEKVDKRLIQYAMANQRVHEMHNLEEVFGLYQSCLTHDLAECLLQDSSYFLKYKIVLVSRNTDSKYLKSLTSRVLSLNAWIKDGASVSKEFFLQTKEAVLFVLAAGFTTVDHQCATTVAKLWVQTTGAEDFDATCLPEYFAREISKFANKMLDIAPDFMVNFMHNYYSPSILPSLISSTTPGSNFESNLREFLALEFSQKEHQWIERNATTPSVELLDTSKSPFLLNGITSNLPAPLLLEKLGRVAPFMASTCTFRAATTLSLPTVDVLSRTRPTLLYLNSMRQYPDLELAPMIVRMSDTLRVLSLNDVTELSDASCTAIGQLKVLQRLILGSGELSNAHLDMMLQNPAKTLLNLSIECQNDITNLSSVTRCSKLSFLQLKHLQSITNAHFCEVLSSMTDNLRHLSLEDLPWLGDDGLEAISKLQIVNRLSTLHVGCMTLTMQGLRGIAKNCKNLEQFSTTQLYQISSDDWVEFFTSLPQLKRVSVQANQFGNPGMASLVTNCKKIEELYLRASRVDFSWLFTPDISLQHLTLAQLDNCTNIDDKILIKLIDLAPNLARLDISYCARVTDASIVHAATHAHHMCEFIIDYCSRVTDEGVLALTQMQSLRVLGITALNIASATICALLANMRALEVVYVQQRGTFSAAANKRINAMHRAIVFVRLTS